MNPLTTRRASAAAAAALATVLGLLWPGGDLATVVHASETSRGLWEGDPVTYQVLDWTLDRYVVGDPHNFKKAAEIRLKDCLEKIPAYQEIVRDKLTENDPRWYFLMEKATKELVKSVKKVVRKTNIDLVCDVGAVEAVGGTMTDLTGKVAEELEK